MRYGNCILKTPLITCKVYPGSRLPQHRAHAQSHINISEIESKYTYKEKDNSSGWGLGGGS